ncbi:MULTISPECIES: SMP-30/gluconolactonase/LRE family protein [Micromonospora]|uniref:Sugar lactone lactonase YvrE n=1 Tax=Micromonospora yangpuensis TaxID=683228 RepID=A0A1C6UMT5_9ACTN|nr:SMP-30/gluconolactonase/LRE family protein [Micromonospora yangpuensis]GGM28129.1 calcium-binding protein [Micromonospora yangpuensis]SCL55340.1 Sugar lactone lactonase YvrE [Micromonospora yangpuensis]
MTGSVRMLTEPVAHHGEGPIWDDRLDRLVWVDMLAGRVLLTDLTGRTTAVEVPDPVAAFVRPIAGAADHLVVGERTLWRVDLTAGADPDRTGPVGTGTVGTGTGTVGAGHPERVGELPLADGVRSNDGGCAPDGTLFVGTMAYDTAPGRGDVFVLRADGRIEVALAGTTVSNGQQFLDDRRVLFVDSPTGLLREYRRGADDRWTAPREVAACAPGSPDGMCVDADGGVWVALFDGAMVRRWSRDGELTDEIALPVRRPTSVALGGPDRRTLFVTTSALGREPGGDPAAGALFVVDVEVPGVPVHPWRPVSVVPSGARRRDG